MTPLGEGGTLVADVSLVTDSLRAHPPTGAWLVRVRRRGYQRMLVIHTRFNLYYFWEKRWFFLAIKMSIKN